MPANSASRVSYIRSTVVSRRVSTSGSTGPSGAAASRIIEPMSTSVRPPKSCGPAGHGCPATSVRASRKQRAPEPLALSSVPSMSHSTALARATRGHAGRGYRSTGPYPGGHVRRRHRRAARGGAGRAGQRPRAVLRLPRRRRRAVGVGADLRRRQRRERVVPRGDLRRGGGDRGDGGRRRAGDRRGRDDRRRRPADDVLRRLPPAPARVRRPATSRSTPPAPRASAARSPWTSCSPARSAPSTSATDPAGPAASARSWTRLLTEVCCRPSASCGASPHVALGRHDALGQDPPSGATGRVRAMTAMAPRAGDRDASITSRLERRRAALHVAAPDDRRGHRRRRPAGHHARGAGAGRPPPVAELGVPQPRRAGRRRRAPATARRAATSTCSSWPRSSAATTTTTSTARRAASSSTCRPGPGWSRR